MTDLDRGTVTLVEKARAELAELDLQQNALDRWIEEWYTRAIDKCLNVER